MLLQHILSGLATGAVYALLGLAIAMTYQATRRINLAQGEMAMFTTFVAWQLMVPWGVPYWPAFLATVVFAFLLGAAVQRLVMHPLRNAPVRFQIGATVALLFIFNSLAGFFWEQHLKALPTPFDGAPVLGLPLLSAHREGMIAVTIVALAALFIFLLRTRIGLKLRAAAENPVSARMVGIRADRMALIGWGVAASLGAVAGMLIAPIVLVEPQMMFLVFPYAVAAAVLGGLGSIAGPVVGGFALGTIETLATNYLPQVGRELKLTIAVAVILLVLTVRPQGLMGRRPVERV